MITATLVALLLSVPIAGGAVDGLVPGDGIALEPAPTVGAPLQSPRPPRTPPGSPHPFGAGALGALGLLGAAAVAAQRRRRSMETLFVVVHGNGGSADDFDALLEQLSVEDFDVVAFDWRSAGAGETSTEASQSASTADAAGELDALIRDLAEDHGNIYVIGQSKGGAATVAMIAALDDGTRPPIDGLRGAALLDPAIGSGLLGTLQRLGSFSTRIPDNGRFDPVACTDEGCRDVRAHLGDASGVEVIAVRNPDAVVTNFRDEPEGMRVFDLIDDGKPSALWSSSLPWVFASRVAEAHASVLTHWAVADCVSAEALMPGTCTWKGDMWNARYAWWRSTSTRPEQ